MKRKIIILCVLTLGMLCLSCKSKEDKAMILIHDYFHQTMSDFDSYEAIDIRIDSSFNSPLTDNNVLSFAKEHQSLLDTNSFRNAVAGVFGDDGYFIMMKDSMKIFNDMLNSFDYSFNGWAACHKFRCKDNLGRSQIKTVFFFFDMKMDKIVAVIDPLDENFEKVFQLISKIYLPSMENKDKCIYYFDRLVKMYNEMYKTESTSDFIGS